MFFTKKASIYPIVGGIQGALFLIVGAVPTFVAFLTFLILRSGAGIFLSFAGERVIWSVMLRIILTFMFGLWMLAFLHSAVLREFMRSSIGALIGGLISVFMTPQAFPEVKTAGLLLIFSSFVTMACIVICNEEAKRIAKRKVRIKQVDEETLKLIRIMENIKSSADFYARIVNALYYICTGLGVLFVGSMTVFSHIPVYSYVHVTSHHPNFWSILLFSLAFTMPLALVFSFRKYLYWTGVAFFSILAVVLVAKAVSSRLYINVLGLIALVAAVAMPVLALMLSPILKHQRLREKVMEIGELL